MVRKLAAVAALVAGAFTAAPAAAQDFPGQAEFRGLYKELIETNTTLSAGSCTLAAERMAARLKAAGYPEKDVRVLAPADRPKDGNLVAVVPGTDPKLKPLLLLAHIDVVEARREDWERDPFTLVEENGYFYARGAADDKAMAAAFTDALIRYRKEGFKPRRTLKLALTCGEETPDTFNGVSWLLKTHPDTLAAEFALNEGAGGRLAGDKRVFLGIQAGEKVYQDFTLETTNPGGHSSRPVKDNAIYRLAAAISRIGAHDFPARLNEATRLHFERMAPIVGGQLGADMTAALATPMPADVVARIARDPGYNSMMRTTCVATMVSAGHAPNALPQRATANVNCRILPGESVASVQAALTEVMADPGIRISAVGEPSPVSPAPPLTPAITRPAERVAGELWPGVPLVPAMATGATDGRFLLAAGIPTYGLSGMFGEPDGGGAHGLNERIRVRSLYEGREFLYRVVKAYANAR
ncbi:M20/M25/M40 family metallo-hydrolase [Phenylobacterium sp.]|uniref:M20/M25/M40 family metallo-hydrolase n=1 Tax=Phenylobacterium sp. TaxID=1871053 RepID=UPI002C26A01E|nr:M20/M25/M40 family metallo-hydrolase [Phenylobacterium sp.]HVI32786.1 M20/M25/M40 family metallo-hydrolase [Phenylobacterium sp.]